MGRWSRFGGDAHEPRGHVRFRGGGAGNGRRAANGENQEKTSGCKIALNMSYPHRKSNPEGKMRQRTPEMSLDLWSYARALARNHWRTPTALLDAPMPPLRGVASLDGAAASVRVKVAAASGPELRASRAPALAGLAAEGQECAVLGAGESGQCIRPEVLHGNAAELHVLV